jgi:actin-related protein 5
VRSAFEANVVTTLEVQEAVLDHAFERLALRGGRVAHPLLMTEPLLAPPSTRARLAELVFEAYGAPALAFGADAAFAWAAASRSETGALRGAVAGVVAACGHSATHALPVVAGAPLLSAAVRLAPGGLAVTEHLASLLAARYPGLLGVGAAGGSGLGGRAEEVKHALCHVALSYADEARRYAQLQCDAAQRRFGAAADGDADEAHGSGGGARFPPGALACVQLPWTPVAVAQQPAPPTAEELARQAERKKAAVSHPYRLLCLSPLR